MDKLVLGDAGALVAFSSAANAGITVPAGDWTVDIGGVVNAYYTSTNLSGANTLGYGGTYMAGGSQTHANITTGLLPNYLAVSGKTRQNDLDVAFTISINPGASTTAGGKQSSQQENRQAFLTVGDASWGSIKLGKDLGIYASDAILNDMTLLGVGSGAGTLAGNTTTLGRIGTGFMYADWKSQVSYTSPNWNGFQFTAGVTQPFNAIAVGDAATPISATSNGQGGSEPAFEGKVSYAFTANEVTGKVWVSGISQKVKGLTNASAAYTTVASNGTVTGHAAVANSITSPDDRAESWDIGGNVSFAGLSLTGYYYQGSGIGQTIQLNHGFDINGKARDSEGGYVQAVYTVPTIGTKLGVSWGESSIDANSSEAATGNQTDEMWTVGAYHPLTKAVNLVAEYSHAKSEISGSSVSANNRQGKADTVSLGAILFF